MHESNENLLLSLNIDEDIKDDFTLDDNNQPKRRLSMQQNESYSSKSNVARGDNPDRESSFSSLRDSDDIR